MRPVSTWRKAALTSEDKPKKTLTRAPAPAGIGIGRPTKAHNLQQRLHGFNTGMNLREILGGIRREKYNIFPDTACFNKPHIPRLLSLMLEAGSGKVILTFRLRCW